MSSSNITIASFHLALKRVANWKSPGPDCIHGFWVKYFTSLHPIMLQYFNSFLDTDGTALPPSLLCGQTTLIMKNAAKGCIPSNYRPTTCLSVVWKLFSNILRDK